MKKHINRKAPLFSGYDKAFIASTALMFALCLFLVAYNLLFKP